MYTVDPTVDYPVMLLNKHIGWDSEDGMGIDGADFQRELLELDSMGKKGIKVIINCPGGEVMQGYNICNAILKSNTPVDTYNAGLAASIAGVIFMMGRKRIMADFASLMIHPPSGSDKKSLDAISNSLITMMAARSNISETDVKYLMDRTTWLSCADCLEKGFCTEIEYTSEINKKRMPSIAATTALWKESNKILNSALNINTSAMTKITMKLGLNDAATEDNVISEIKKIEDRAYQSDVEKIAAENKLRDLQNKANAEKLELEGKLTGLQAIIDSNKIQIDKITNTLTGLQTEKDAAEKAAKLVKAEAMVKGYAKAGRIKNDATVITKWVGRAVDNYEETEDLIKEIPLHIKAVEITEFTGKLEPGVLPTTAMGLAVKNKLVREGKI